LKGLDLRPRGKIIESYPPDVKEQIDRMIDANFTARMIYEWLKVNWFPKWEKSHPEWCVTERTVENYLRYYAPEKRLLSASYIRSAVERLEEDVKIREDIQKAISELWQLYEKADSDKEKRLILRDIILSERVYFDICARLGIIEEKQKMESEESFAKMLEKLRKEREKEILKKALGGTS
jgi:hypothetical protein